MPLTRRHFLQSTSLLTVPALTGGLSITTTARANGANGDRLVCLFQRGGVDGLSMVVPYGDLDYYNARPSLAIPEPNQGDDSALELDPFFGLHPAMAALKPLFEQGALGIVQATGLTSETRSHFDAQDFMERAYLSKTGLFTGWLGRHLSSTSGSDSPFRAVGMGNSTQKSLVSETVSALALSSVDSFALNMRSREAATLETVLARLYDGGSALDVRAQQTLEAAAQLAEFDPAQYPPENGATYPASSFGQTMLQVAQLLKTEALGIEVICVDLGGFDTHAQQATVLPPLLADMANSLAAFYTDMGERMNRTTVITMSEFGRRVAENGSGGTDHGHGNVMFALGNQVNGGRVYGTWPGLASSQLDRGDLAITTDWRMVLGELVYKRLGNTDLATVFPDYAMPNFLGLFR